VLKIRFALHDAREKMPDFGRKMRRLFFRFLAVLASFLFLLVILVFCAGWYTSRSDFCRSCHIMEPYYDSWKASSHKDVPCIECHFAPGFGGKLRGKMLGLVQLAKYVTSSEGPRPAAEVPDASCLRFGCHETRLLSGMSVYKGINFDHSPHLGETRRGMQLRCTSCHSQIVQGEEHMAVTLTTCYLCHFKNMPFNEDLSACTNCHQIPDKEFDLGGGVKFTHDLAYKKGVDCINCHSDVIRGKGEVPRERCMVCHNREGDLARITDYKFMHQKHVSDHKIDCLDCHLKIEHSLDKNRLMHFAENCQSCHPDHHEEQIKMFQGVGSEMMPGLQGGMTATRIVCQACHKVKEVSSTGTVLWSASMKMCSTCHEASEVQELKSYHDSLRVALPKIKTEIARARQALETASLKPERAKAVAEELDKIQHDLDFLIVGEDIHNIHYASKLEDILIERIAALCRELGIEEPKITIPTLRK
jgi:nitrate/TMAO reductase-like tetraheme cytochrome c subunit